MDDFDLFEELISLRKKQKQILDQSVKEVSDYVMNMDFASLYPSELSNSIKATTVTMTMRFPNKMKSKIEKINKILENVRKGEENSTRASKDH